MEQLHYLNVCNFIKNRNILSEKGAKGRTRSIYEIHKQNKQKKASREHKDHEIQVNY